MLDYQNRETVQVQCPQAAPTRLQIQLTRLLATGLPAINLPGELVEAVKHFILQEWSPTLSVHEDAVLRTLLALTIERARRDCVIDLDHLWPVVQSVLSSGVINPFEAEKYHGDPQENHESSMHQLVAKGLVNFTICDEGWICSINFLWNPEFQSVGAFAANARNEVD